VENASDTPPVIRAAELLAVARDAAVARLSVSDDPQWVHGILSAYGWVSGEAATAPVSGEDRQVTLEAMRHEERLADDTIYGLPGAYEVDRRFAVGAQNALMWLRGADPNPPI
jgi:hypothetical protein